MRGGRAAARRTWHIACQTGKASTGFRSSGRRRVSRNRVVRLQESPKITEGDKLFGYARVLEGGECPDTVAAKMTTCTEGDSSRQGEGSMEAERKIVRSFRHTLTAHGQNCVRSVRLLDLIAKEQSVYVCILHQLAIVEAARRGQETVPDEIRQQQEKKRQDEIVWQKTRTETAQDCTGGAHHQ